MAAADRGAVAAAADAIDSDLAGNLEAPGVPLSEGLRAFSLPPVAGCFLGCQGRPHC